MDTLRPDERAAGVISGADPYRELELYLEKVNEEIGEVFDRWKTTDRQSPTPSPSPEPHEPASPQPPGGGRQPPSAAIPIPSAGPARAPSSPAAKGRRAPSPDEAVALCNGAAGDSPPPPPAGLAGSRLHHNGHAPGPAPEPQPQRPRSRQRALKSRDSSSLPSRGKRGSRPTDDYSLDQWSEGILAEFNSIIADELSELARQQEARKEQQQQRLSNGHARRRDASPSDGDAPAADAVAEMRLRVARSRSWDNPPPPPTGADSDSTPPPSPAPSPCASEASASSGSAASLLPQRALGLARALQRPRPRGQLPTDAPRHGDAVLVRVASLPDADFLRADREPAAGAAAGKPPRSRDALSSPLAKTNTTGRPAKARDADAQGAPRQQLRSRSDEHLLKNGRASPAAKSGGGGGGTLRRLLDGRSSTRERPHKRKVDAGVATDDGPTWPAPVPDSGDEACSPGRISVLPVALQSLLTRIRPRRGNGSGSGSGASSPARCASPCGPGASAAASAAAAAAAVAAGCCGAVDSSSPSPVHGAAASAATSPHYHPRDHEEEEGEDGGGGPPVDAGTQTSPPLSRSSSFTWVSDCSSSLLLEDEGDGDGASSAPPSPASSSSVGSPPSSSSSSSDGCRSSRDSLSDSPSPGGSAGSPEREEPESGIGTASPPRARDHLRPPHAHAHVHADALGGAPPQKQRRKDAWERLRRRQQQHPAPAASPTREEQHLQELQASQRLRGALARQQWVRHESVETQTNGPTSSTADASPRGDGSGNATPTEPDSDDAPAPSPSPSPRASATASGARSLPLSNRPRAARPHCLPVTPQHARSPPAPHPPRGSPATPPAATATAAGGPPLLAARGPPPPQPASPGSPSCASLKLNGAPLVAELGNKSSSAPLLLKAPAGSPGGAGARPEDGAKKRVLTQPRSQSERHLAEIEATEACKWLRAAGFPQYAQMYEDLQFPIDVSGVQKDHPFLDADSLQSLFRRLHALNRCAKMKVDNLPKNKADDSDEDDHCALSENWTFQPESRRWSRVCDVTAQHAERLQALCASSQQGSVDRSPGGEPALEPSVGTTGAATAAVAAATPPAASTPATPATPGAGSGGARTPAQPPASPATPAPGTPAAARLLDEDEEDEDFDTEAPVISAFRYGSLPPGALTPGDQELLAVRFRRTGSERLRDGAKALLRRMESLKASRRKRQHREGVVISGPQVLDVATMQQRMKDLNCVDVSPTSATPPDVIGHHHQQATSGDGAGSEEASDGSGSAATTPAHARAAAAAAAAAAATAPRLSRSGHHRSSSRRLSRRAEETGALSDSEVQPTSWRQQYLKDANSNHTKVLEFVDARTRGPQDQDPSQRITSSKTQAARAGSLNLGKESQRYRDKLQHAFGRDTSSYRDKSGSSELTASQDSSSTLASQPDSDHDEVDVTPRHKAVVVRWHSFQRGSGRPDSCLFRPPEGGPLPGSRPMGSLSCGQLLVLRKLALLKLTACMERYCPTHRTGWNWELPKFIRKIKAPDYKDKTVFGVPLLLSLQRNGQALPKCIQAALRWLRVNALDQVGIFRKSGVRSRIQKLKLMAEMQGEHISYEGQQAYDVADMVKQYFRELPEALLTNKLSETFIAIFQHVPVELRAEAVQCVLLLLPDEHREALQTLLEFLHQVSARSACNQMNPSNLAVCLAPSLFHLHHTPTTASRSASVSPRRRKTVGVPDPRELNENKAAHDCLLYLIKEHKELFVVAEDMLAQCHFNYMEESIPVALDELGAEFQQDWRGYLYACTTALLKEAREKSRGWVNMTCTTDHQVDMAYKKVGDGHPLRLWKVSTEVEAPPQELLQRVLRERHVWDYSLLKWRVVARLDPQVEVFQYVCANMAPLPAKDYCVLRSWRTDLPKGACVIVETSVEHHDAQVMLGGVRGIVLASRYLIEPCGSGKSRIMHLSRVDTKGRTPEWYNKSYGHICALYLTRIRTSFKHNTDGPESKV